MLFTLSQASFGKDKKEQKPKVVHDDKDEGQDDNSDSDSNRSSKSKLRQAGARRPPHNPTVVVASFVSQSI